jgi:hypothetical protein
MFPWLEALVPIPEMSAIFVSAKNALHRETPLRCPWVAQWMMPREAIGRIRR